MDDIVKSLQYIIDGGGEDDIEDGGRVFKTASAFEIKPIDEDSDKKEEDEEEEEKEEWEGEDNEEVEVEEDDETASRSLNSPHLSIFLSIDTREDIGSSSSSSSALVYSPVKVRKEHQIEEHQDTAALSTQLQLPATASKMYTSEYSSAAADAAAIAVQFKLYEESSEEASSSSASSSSSSSSSVIESRTTFKASSSFLS